MPLCISVRFQIVFCALVICSSALVTMLDTMSSSAVAMINSISENPACARSAFRTLELRRLQRDDRGFRNQRAADRRFHGGDDGHTLDARRRSARRIVD